MNLAESRLPLTPDILEDLAHDDAYQVFLSWTLIVLVTGGRNYGVRPPGDSEPFSFGARYMEEGLTLRNTLHRLNPSLIIHGAARGADSLADSWAEVRGIPREPYPAQWRQNGQFVKSAGHQRNRRMAAVLDWYRRQGKEVLIVAFPGGSGTAGMVQLAREYDFPLEVIS